MTELLLSNEDVASAVYISNKSTIETVCDVFPKESWIGPIVPPLLSILVSSYWDYASDRGQREGSNGIVFRDVERQMHRLESLGEWAIGWTSIMLKEVWPTQNADIATNQNKSNSEISHCQATCSSALEDANQSCAQFLEVMNAMSQNQRLSSSAFLRLMDLLPQLLTRRVLSRAILASRELVAKSFKKTIRNAALNEACNAFVLASQLETYDSSLSESQSTSTYGPSLSMSILGSLSQIVPWVLHSDNKSKDVEMLIYHRLFRRQTCLPKKAPSLLSEILACLPHDVFLLFYIRLWGFGLFIIRRLAFIFVHLANCSLQQEVQELKKNLAQIVDRIQPRKEHRVMSHTYSNNQLNPNSIVLTRLNSIRSSSTDEEYLDLSILIEECKSKQTSLVQTCEHLGMTAAQRIGDVIKDIARATEAEVEGCLSRWSAFLQVHSLLVYSLPHMVFHYYALWV